jgi:DNA-binding beta-propeller fold protein YncE
VTGPAHPIDADLAAPTALSERQAARAPGETPAPFVHMDLNSRQLGTIATLKVGNFPTAALVDPVNGELYVMNSGGTGVHLINGTTVVTRIPVGEGPTGAVFDPRNGFVYVDDSDAYNVTIINGTKDVANVSTGAYSTSIAYDSADGFVYVANYGGKTVTILNGTSTAASLDVSVGFSTPYAVAYDPADGEVYVLVIGNASIVTIIRGTSIVGNITLPRPAFPNTLIYAPSDGDMYVLDGGTDNVTVLNGTSVVGTVDIGAVPEGAVYDSDTGAVYVSATQYRNATINETQDLSVILNGTLVEGSVVIPFQASVGTCDAADGDVFWVGNSSSVAVINSTSVVASVLIPGASFGLQYDPSNQYVYVMDTENNEVSVLAYAEFYNVTFSESGLPAGVSWTVSVAGLNQTTAGPSMTFVEPNGTFAYRIASLELHGFPIPLWNETPLPLNGTVFVNGTAIQEPSLNFTVYVQVVFSQNGLPSNSSWSVTLDSVEKTSHTGQIMFGVLPGVYPYSIGSVPGYYQNTFPGSGLLNVSGNNGTFNESYVYYEPTLEFLPISYLVEVSESGLPSGEQFAVVVDGSFRSLTTDGGTDTLTWPSFPNGSYPYTIEPIAGWRQATLASGGFLTVAGGSGPTNGTGVGFTSDLAYVAVTYPVRFAESGLPAGTSWTVVLASVGKSTTGPTIWFAEPNGTFSFRVSGVAGYRVNASTGSVSVSPAGAFVSLEFTAVTYSVTFSESGLPSGAMFQVTLAGTPKSLTSDGGVDSLSFVTPNGTLAYGIAGVVGWRQGTLPSEGALTVNGGSVTETTLAYTAVTYSVSFNESGLPGGTSWSVTLDDHVGSSIGPSVDFSEPNGTYSYSIENLAGWHESTLSYQGTLTVAGSAVEESTLAFAQVLYGLTFTETGLATGTNWSVVVGSTILHSTSGSITFEVANGTESYEIETPSGYQVGQSSGSVGISGGGKTLPVSFTTHTPSASPAWAVPAVAGIGAGVVIGLLAALALASMMRGRRKGDPGRPPPSDDPYQKQP